MVATAQRTILIATDSNEVFDDVDAALADGTTEVLRVRTGREVLAAVKQVEPDLVILDLQIGNMGGVAACLGLRNEESFGRVEPQKVIILLDRIADVFIARRSGADGWLIKPINPLRLRRAAQTVLAGESYTEGEPVEVAEIVDEPTGPEGSDTGSAEVAS